MTNDAANNPEHQATFRLSEEDFTHIWLRHKDRMWRLTLLYIGLATALVGAIGLAAINRIGKQTVDRYVSTEAFKTTVLEYLSGSLIEINEQVTATNARVEGISHTLNAIHLDAKKLSTIPYEITDYGFSIVTAEGKAAYVEFGMLTPGQSEVQFRSPFTGTPAMSFQMIGALPPGTRIPTVLEISEGGFKADSRGRPAFWIAIGG